MPITQVTTASKSQVLSISRMIGSYQNGQPNQYDVRLDDIVLSTERIGCD